MLPCPAPQRLDLVALIISVANNLLQIIGTMWLLLHTVRLTNYRKVAAAPAKVARGIGRVVRGGTCARPKPTPTAEDMDVESARRVEGQYCSCQSLQCTEVKKHGCADRVASQQCASRAMPKQQPLPRLAMACSEVLLAGTSHTATKHSCANFWQHSKAFISGSMARHLWPATWPSPATAETAVDRRCTHYSRQNR